MNFRIWCRWGELPLDSTDIEAATEEAASFAWRNGKSVVLMDQDRNDLLYIPPTLQSDMVAALLFGDLSHGFGIVALN